MTTRAPHTKRVETLNYRKGGFHPVHLNDVFKKDRYTVIHKLGHGGFATVWLARDSTRNRYVALKILAARLSTYCPEVDILRRLKNSSGEGGVGKEYVMSMLDHFYIDGPNGKHLCVVSEVGGPSIKLWNESPGLRSGSRRLTAGVARKVALQAVEGLAFIHSTGTVHGDFTAANILMKLANIDEWTVEEIHERLGHPHTENLHHTNKRTGTSQSPEYTVNAISMREVEPKWLSDQIMVIDFGIAFLNEQSSPDIGTPKSHCAPELFFDCARSYGSDIWALGCTIFEVRTGSCLFPQRNTSTSNQILISMVKVLGTLPQIWWDKWDDGRDWYATESKEGGEVFHNLEGTLMDKLLEIGVHDGELKAKHPVPAAPKDQTQRKSGSTDEPSSSRKTGSSEKEMGSTNRLLALVEELTTSEADEVMAALVNRGSADNSKSNSNSSNNKKNSNNGSASSGEKSASSGDKSASAEKSISSEGLSTGKGSGGAAVNKASSLVTGEGMGIAGSVEDATASAIVTDFLEPAGTRISLEEAEGLENLLRKGLTYLPEDRLAPSEMAKHHWFFDDFKVAAT